MAVTGFTGAYIAALIGGNEFRWYYIKRDDELIDMIIKLESVFWNYVVTNTPPPIDGSQASSDLLTYLYSKSIPKSQIILPDNAITLIEEYESFSEQEKYFALKKEEACSKLKAMLGDNETGICQGRTVTWKSIDSERFDSKKLRAEMSELYEKYVNKTSYRRFSIK